MKREALLRELRAEARKLGVDYQELLNRGKGSHYRIFFGDKTTTVQSGELNPLQVKRIKKQLGL